MIDWNNVITSAVTAIIVSILFWLFKIPNYIVEWLFLTKLDEKRKKQYKDELKALKKSEEAETKIIIAKHAEDLDKLDKNIYLGGFYRQKYDKARQKRTAELEKLKTNYESKLLRLKEKYIDLDINEK